MNSETMKSSTLLDKYSIAFEQYLDKTENLIVILLDANLSVQGYNHAFLQLNVFRNGTEKLTGKDVRNFLLPESHQAFEFPDQDAEFKKTKLNFSVSGTVPMSMSCYIFRTNKSYLIIGDKLILNNTNILDRMSSLNNEIVNIARELQQKNRELEMAYSKIKILSGIVPICMHCKEIRDDKGYWNQVEKYISEHSDAQFSHGVCPKCMEKYYSEFI